MEFISAFPPYAGIFQKAGQICPLGTPQKETSIFVQGLVVVEFDEIFNDCCDAFRFQLRPSAFADGNEDTFLCTEKSQEVVWIASVGQHVGNDGKEVDDPALDFKSKGELEPVVPLSAFFPFGLKQPRPLSSSTPVSMNRFHMKTENAALSARITKSRGFSMEDPCGRAWNP